MKKKYAILFEGLFEYGYVKSVFFQKSKTIKIGSIEESKKFATKFRFKWVANLLCRICNWSSKVNFDLRTYKVVEV